MTATTANPGPAALARPGVAVAAPATKSARPTAPTVQLGVAEPPARMPRGPEPVAGGPRTRKKARGECPKCKSKGVVLARSYSGDEYYSCIYCGWQAYKAVDEDDPNASLAARLLGQTAGPE
jgi:Zn ribbon nucleic-acid-binding protein